MIAKASAGAIVLAAGLSSRMGSFKLTLPWGETTVIGQVVRNLARAGVTAIVVVTGHRAGEVIAALEFADVKYAHNADYANGEMLASIRTGLAALPNGTCAALLCLGDQPQMQPEIIHAVLSAGAETNWDAVIVPSDGSRAGHPILLPRRIWPDVLRGLGTLRDVLREHRESVRYLVLDSPTILADLDTPRDYEQERPGGSQA